MQIGPPLQAIYLKPVGRSFLETIPFRITQSVKKALTAMIAGQGFFIVMETHIYCELYLAPQRGLEPRTRWLTAICSTD